MNIFKLCTLTLSLCLLTACGTTRRHGSDRDVGLASIGATSPSYVYEDSYFGPGMIEERYIYRSKDGFYRDRRNDRVLRELRRDEARDIGNLNKEQRELNQAERYGDRSEIREEREDVDRARAELDHSQDRIERQRRSW